MKDFLEWAACLGVVLEAQKECPNPQCRAVFAVPDWLDTPVKCPKCRTPIGQPAPAPEPKKLRGWDKDDFWKGHDGMRDPFGRI